MAEWLPKEKKHWVTAGGIVSLLFGIFLLVENKVKHIAYEAVEEKIIPPPIVVDTRSVKVVVDNNKQTVRFYGDVYVTPDAGKCEVLRFSRSFRPSGSDQLIRAYPLAVSMQGANGAFPDNPFKEPGLYKAAWTEYRIRYGEQGTYSVYGVAAGCPNGFLDSWLLLAVDYDWRFISPPSQKGK